MIYHFKLVDRVPVPCTLEEAEGEFRKDRHVAQTEVGSLWVSTVFLVFNHASSGTPPKLFETMIFGSAKTAGQETTTLRRVPDYQERCGTWEEAEAMHAKAVAYAEDWSPPS